MFANNKLVWFSFSEDDGPQFMLSLIVELNQVFRAIVQAIEFAGVILDSTEAQSSNLFVESTGERLY